MVFRRIAAKALYTAFPWYDRRDDSDDTSAESLTAEEIESIVEHRSKEDEDAAMFLTLLEKMPVQSTLFILQNHVRHKIVPEAQMQQALQKKQEPLLPEDRREIVKQFRFAEVLGGQHVRTVVHEVPHVADMDQEEIDLLWYSKEEQQALRANTRKAVRYFQHNYPQLQESLTILAESYQIDSDDVLVEHKVKSLSQGFSARGLEPHLCPLIHSCRSASIHAVLLEQEKQRMRMRRKQKKRREKEEHRVLLLEQRQQQYAGTKSFRTRIASDGNLASLLTRVRVSLKRSKSQESLACESESSFDKIEDKTEASFDDCMENNDESSSEDSEEMDAERIREIYSQASMPSVTLAKKIAECDYLEALKASISPCAF